MTIYYAKAIRAAEATKCEKPGSNHYPSSKAHNCLIKSNDLGINKIYGQ